MCQMSIFVKEGEKEKLLKEDITTIEVLDKGLRVSTLFEGPTEFHDLILKRIDFMAGKVMLEKF